VKNDSGILVDRGFTGAAPIGPPKRPGFSRKLVLVATSALFFCAALGIAQPADAESLRVADISAALRGADTAKPVQPQQQTVSDDAFAALSDFTQQIKAKVPAPANIKTSINSGNQVDDQALSALQDFAKRLGTAQPESIKDLPQTAEADNLLDFLKGGGASAPADKTKAAPAAKTKGSRPPADATFVGSKVCATCHSPLIAEFQKTLMGRISLTQKGKFECENCHGPGSAHVKAGGGRGVGGIMGFGPTDPRTTAEKNQVCLTCHEKGDRTYWNGSTHESRGLECTNCHTVMKEVSRKHNLKTASEMDTCFQCHKDRRAQMFRSSHMPLREGKIVCSDCHNPHGSQTASLLRADSINDNCYKCHAEKRGPFLFEHAPVRENCLNCHDPHGSVNEFMLKISRVRLCTECHAFGHGQASGPQAVQTISRSCNNCHTEVHGTNSPSGPLLHR
jgi:DmsE family decaheme c-type cytochrome